MEIDVEETRREFEEWVTDTLRFSKSKLERDSVHGLYVDNFTWHMWISYKQGKISCLPIADMLDEKIKILEADNSAAAVALVEAEKRRNDLLSQISALQRHRQSRNELAIRKICQLELEIIALKAEEERCLRIEAMTDKGERG